MRSGCLGFVLTGRLLPNVGNAQVLRFRTPPPDVSAAAAEWQINSTPIVVGGLSYDATRAFRLFDGQVMSQTGLFEGVPVYSDTTIEPYSELYVPVGNGRMRVYERRRERELAGKTASHVSTFPVDRPSVPSPSDRLVGAAGPVGTSGAVVPRTGEGSAELADRPRSRRTSILTATPPSSAANGVWLEFGGARWYSDGPAVSFSPDRFEPVGEYRGFPVFRDKNGSTSDIWVSVVKDGPLAPYRRR
jgi:hypothetical protein